MSIESSYFESKADFIQKKNFSFSYQIAEAITVLFRLNFEDITNLKCFLTKKQIQKKKDEDLICFTPRNKKKICCHVKKI